MLYIENIGLQDCSGFLQIESHLWKTHNHYICVDIKELNKTVEFLSYENFWKALKNFEPVEAYYIPHSTKFWWDIFWYFSPSLSKFNP